MSQIIKLMGLFVKIDDGLILFNSFGGKRFDDSPRVIYEQMKKDPRYNKYRLVWAIREPDKMMNTENVDIIKADTLKYFLTALKARIWITNSSMERGLDFKKKKTLCFNTWHGTPIKLMGIDIKEENQSFRSKTNVRADIMLAQSQYDIDIFSHAFQLPLSCFRVTGLPRNDILTCYTDDDIKRIKEKIGIKDNITILLYAPTFREYCKGSENEVVLKIPINLKHWQEILGEKYLILFRAHYEVARHMKVNDFPLFMDVTSYPDLNELMIVSDALISDYSSVYFDYSITHKPMYCFAYDYEEYTFNRGMYINLEDELPCVIHRDENSLLEDLLKLEQNRGSMCAETKRFQEKYVTECGNGAKACCDIIANELGIEFD